jgi:hypothetical protein
LAPSESAYTGTRAARKRLAKPSRSRSNAEGRRIKSHVRVALIGGGAVGCAVLDPGHLELDAFLAGIGTQDVLERLGSADADDRAYCLRCYTLIDPRQASRLAL